MAHGIRVVCVEIVHDDFSRVTANLTVLVGQPGASGTSRFNEQFDLRQLARNVGVRDVWVVPTDRKMPEPLREALGLRSGQALTDKAPTRWRAFREQPELQTVSYLLRHSPRAENGVRMAQAAATPTRMRVRKLREDCSAWWWGAYIMHTTWYILWTYRLDGCAEGSAVELYGS